MSTRTEQNIWKPGFDITSDLTGFSIEALDGGIGKVDEHTMETASSYLVVDTGPWILGKKVMLPGGVIDSVDYDTETVHVNRTKEQIKDAPEFDETTYRDEPYRSRLGSYYGTGEQRSRTLN